MKVRIYVEGGGRTSWDECRLGFAELLRAAVPELRPRILPCGGRERAFEDFGLAVARHPDEVVLLLVDAERATRSGESAWAHLSRHDRWRRPEAAGEDSAHLMIEVMEAWLLADPAALARFYGQGFRPAALPEPTDVERLSKRDVMSRLTRATRASARGAYHKTRHGFALLARIDARRLRRGAAGFERLCRRLASA